MLCASVVKSSLRPHLRAHEGEFHRRDTKDTKLRKSQGKLGLPVLARCETEHIGRVEEVPGVNREELLASLRVVLKLGCLRTADQTDATFRINR